MRDSRLILPGALALLLAVALLVQLLVPNPVDLPSPPPAGGPAQAVATAEDAGRTIASLPPRSIFAPPIRAAIPASAAASPEPAATLAGSIGVSGAAYAIIQTPSGAIRRLRPGQAIGGWRLASLTTSGALFLHGSARAVVPFGAKLPVGSQQTKEGSEP